MIDLKLNLDVTGAACWESEHRLVVTRNTLTHKAADLIANAMARNGAYQISHLYLRFNGTSVVSPLNVTSLRDVVRADFLATDTNAGGFYVPLLTAPAVSSSDTTKYAGNKLTYYFRIPSGIDAQTNGLTNAGEFSISTSRISAMGLAVSQVAGDRTKDLIFSVLQGGNPGAAFTMFQLVDNGQKAIDYPVTIAFA